MQPDHLALYRQPGIPAPHPDGRWAAVAITRPDLDGDTYVSRLWRLDLGDGTLGPLTSGDHDAAPEISPNGGWLAFQRRVGKAPQIFLARLRADGLAEEPWQATNHHLGVSGGLTFDGDTLAYVAPVPEEGRYGTAEDVGPGSEPPRHITDLTYRMDGRGYYLDRPTHIFTLDLAAAEAPDPLADPATGEVEGPAHGGSGLTPVQVSSGTEAHDNPVWFNGAILATRANRNALHPTLVHFAHDGTSRDITIPDQEHPGTSGTWIIGKIAAGEKLWFLLADYGPERMDFIGPAPVLASAGLDPEAGTLTDLTIHTDPSADQLSIVMLVAADDGVYLTREHRGTIDLLRFDGTELTVIGTDTPVVISGGRALAGGGVVVSAETPDGVGDVFAVDGATARRLTDLSARLRSEAGVFELLEHVIPSRDGYPVHGWSTTPDGPGPHPVLLLIHGGPHAAFSPTFFDEVQVYTGAGYAVVLCNPRGSSSYGRAHGRAITGAWGDLDAADITAFLDGVLENRPDLDPDRVGVMGGSYGGYMTAWLTTRSDRWAGAIVERGFLDAFSFEGSSDIGWFFGPQYLGEDRDQVAAQNPMSHIDQVTTATLVIHSEEDWRCPIEQGQRWFVGLKRRGVETEFLVFPGEGHELSRSGTPKHRLARFEHVLSWWRRWLPA